MANGIRIVAFAGSTREGSLNKKLIRIAADGARSEGAEVTLLDLRDFPMPLYDGDHEEKHGVPENAQKLNKIFQEHHGLLISSAEYNSSLTAVLKNTIDWISRPFGDTPALAPFKNKVATIMSASPGGLGGLRGLVHLRAILSNIGVIVLPTQVAVSKADQAFTSEGTLADAKQHSSVENLGKTLANFLKKHTVG